MTLIDSFNKYELTSGQAKLLLKLSDFLRDDSPCFVLKGYAGTGKTFMIKGLTEYLISINRNFVIATPTGRAAKVASDRTGHGAATIHRTIYSNDEIKEYNIEKLNNSESIRFYFSLKMNEDNNDTIYIIDEASMVSDSYSENDLFRFGSGFLLKDLFRYTGIDKVKNSKKIIFIGDNAQLPPVKMNFSPALDEQYLANKYKIKTKTYELTEVVRQKTDSGILQNATKLRKSLKENQFNEIDIKTDFEDIKATSHNDLLDKYLQACNNQIDKETIIIAHSNSSVHSYNKFIRDYFFPNQEHITKGDRIIIIKNNYSHGIELFNGDFATIISVDEKSESRNIVIKNNLLNGKVQNTKVSLSFRNVTIAVRDIDKKLIKINCKIIENVLYSNNPSLNNDETKALYIDFRIRNPNVPKNLLKNYLKVDPYYNALQVKFGYAITCHKSQGGEWKRAFVNCNTHMKVYSENYFRWLYTAITRAKEILYTLDEPHFKIGSSLQPSNNITPKDDLIKLNTEVLEGDTAFNFSENQKELKYIFYAISHKLNDNSITISNIEHKLYHEIYSFKKEDEDAKIKIYYKNDFKISSVMSLTNNLLTKSILEKIKTLEGKKILTTESEPISNFTQKEFVFPDDKPYLKKLFELIKGKANDMQIEIVDIEHNNYHEIYQFKQASLTASYKFWYNGKGVFTKYEIIPNRTTGLTDEINSLITFK